MKNPGLRICPFFNLASMVDNYFELVKTLFTNSKVRNTAYGDGDCRWYKLTCFDTHNVFSQRIECTIFLFRTTYLSLRCKKMLLDRSKTT